MPLIEGHDAPKANGRGIEVTDVSGRSRDEESRGLAGGEPADDGTGASAGIKDDRDEAKPATEQEEGLGEPDSSLSAIGEDEDGRGTSDG